MMDRQQMKILKAFHEATRAERGGEVVVRSGENTSRVFFVGGRIAWVTASTVKRTFTDYLIANSKLEKEEVQEVFEECRRSGANFGETIIEWGLLGEQELRRLLLDHLTDCLLEVFCWDPVESMFVPEERTYKGSLTFELEELLQNVLERDSDGRLPFAGHAVADILEQLRSDREPTMPFMPAFSEDEADAAGPAAATAAAGEEAAPVESDSVLVSEELRRAARQEDAIPTDPPPLDDDLPPPPRSRAPWVVLVLLVLLGAAGLVWLLAGGEPGTVPDQGAAVADAGRPAGEPGGDTSASADGAANQSLASADGDASGTSDTVAAAADGGSVVAVGAGVDAGAGPADAPGSVVAPEAPAVEKPDSIIAGAAGRGTARIKVRSRPPGARVFLDGLYTGRKTPCTLEVPAERVHSVMVARRRYRSVYRTVKPQAGETKTISLRLRRGRDRRLYLPVHFESRPAGARVVLSGRKIKKPAPFPWKLRYDRVTKVQMRLAGHHAWTGFVKPVPGKVVTIRAELESK